MTDVDTAKFKRDIERMKVSAPELLAISGAGAAVIRNFQKLAVPVDTAATKTSIGSHIQHASILQVVDHIGPETDYAPHIEFGTSNPNYPIQPFVRPSVFGREAKIYSAISAAFSAVINL